MNRETLLTLFVYTALFLTMGTPVFSQSYQTNSNTVRTRVGNPTIAIGDWPTNGVITQGPQGTLDHAGLYANGLQAIDIANSLGTPIYSSFDGTAAVVCTDAQRSCGTYEHCNPNGCGYGQHVVIESETEGKKFQVFYGHFSSITIKAGDTVHAGNQLGFMGTTGYSTGSHTHYEFRNLPMTPPYIPKAITPAICNSESECKPNPVSRTQ